MDDEDFMAVRDEIVNRLNALRIFKQIYTPHNSATANEMSQVTPSAHVLFNGISVVDAPKNTNAVMFGKRWRITVACQNAASQMEKGDKANDQAGQLFQKVIASMLGWQPQASARKVEILGAVESYNPTFTYLTLDIQTVSFIEGAA